MIKIDVVSGFLGAGKTTLIKKLLKAYEHEKVVLIENEFGEIGIDGDLIEREGFEVFEISSGCICCIMQKDFIGMLSRVIEEFKPERIIIEPTGISILSDIIEILNKPSFKETCSIHSLVTVIDSMNYLAQCEVFGEFFEDQIAHASSLVLSKSQFVSEEKVKEIIGSLRQLNETAPIVTASWESMSLEDVKALLVGDLAIEFKELIHPAHRPCRENEFDTFAIETSAKYTVESLEEILNELKNPIYGKILRGKGFLKGPGYYLDFSYTNGQFNVHKTEHKSSGKLCLIGMKLDEKELKRLWKAKGGGIFNWLTF